MTSVVSRQESGARGNAAMRAKYPKRVTDAWARKGGRKPHLTWLEIVELEREKKASARTKARSSSRGGSRSDFDSIT